MATWEDGPEYAPVQRPSEYADAGAPPLEPAPPVVDLAAGAPLEQPRFADPSAPVAPLETLIPPVEDPRNPRLPFEVVSSSMTEQSSAWTAAHLRSSGSAAPEPAVAGWPTAPSGGPSSNGWPAPTTQPYASLAPTSGPPPMPGGFPAPGTTQWFAPPPPGAVPVAPDAVTPGRLFSAASPGALICLLVGGLVFPLSPVTLCVALGLSSRATSARRQVKIAYGVVLGLLGLIGMIVLLAGRYDFAEWWLVISRWGQVLSFLLIVTTLVLVGLGLKGRFDARPPRWN